MSEGDLIRSLPVNNDIPKPGDLEFMYRLFQPANAPLINKMTSPFKYAALGAVLFTILSLPVVFSVVQKLFSNPLSFRLALFVLFFIVYFIAEKIFKI